MPLIGRPSLLKRWDDEHAIGLGAYGDARRLAPEQYNPGRQRRSHGELAQPLRPTSAASPRATGARRARSTASSLKLAPGHPSAYDERNRTHGGSHASYHRRKPPWPPGGRVGSRY